MRKLSDFLLRFLPKVRERFLESGSLKGDRITGVQEDYIVQG